MKSHDPVKQNETHVKLLDEKLSGGVESADGVQSRSRVDSDHQNVEQVVGRSSLFQCLVAAALHVRFQSRQGVEVGVDRSIRARGVAANSHKVGVANFHVAAKPNRFPVRRLIVVAPYHLRTTKRACTIHNLTKNTHAHTRLMALFRRTTQVSRYQKGKTNLDFTEARDSEWQWHQLDHMQVCTSLQTPTTQFFTGRMPFLPPNQQRQSTDEETNIIYFYCYF